MNEDQVKQAIRLLCGEWPSPQIDENQITVWSAHMASWSFAEFVEAMQKLVRLEARRFRPTASEVVAVIASRRQRERMSRAVRELPSADSATTPTHNALQLAILLEIANADSVVQSSDSEG